MSPRAIAHHLVHALGHYARWVARRHRAVIVGTLALAAVGTALASTLPLRTEFSWLLPDDRPSVVALRELTARKPSSAVIEVGVASPSPEATRRFASDLAAAIRKALPPDLLRSVDEDDGELRRFVWSHRQMYASVEDLERARDELRGRIQKEEAKANPFLVDLDDDAPKASPSDSQKPLRHRLDEARHAALHPGFVAEEGRLRMLVVRCPFGDTEPEKGKRVLDGIAATVASLHPAGYHPQLEVGYAGDPVSAALEHDLIIRDVATSALACLALVVGVLMLAFRAPRAVLALAISLAAGCALTFGVTRLFVGHLNSSTAFLGSVVAGNGINFGVIFLARYLEERRRGETHEPSLRTAIVRTASPTLVAAAAAGMSYLSLTVTSFRGFSEFGIIAGSGMALCWAMSYLLLPALLTWFERRRPLAAAERFDLSRIAPLMRSRFMRVVPLLAVAVSTGLGIYGALKLSRDPFEDDLRTLRSRSYPTSAPGRWSRRLDAAFGRDQAGGFYLGAAKPEHVPVIVHALRAAERDVPAAQRMFGKIDALPEALPGTPEVQRHKIALLGEVTRLADKVRPNLEPGGDEARLLADLVPATPPSPIGASDLPPGLRRAFTENDGRVGLLIGVHPGPGFIGWSQKSMRRAVGLLRGLDLPDEIRRTLVVSGPEMIFVDMMAAVEHDGPRATVFSLVLVLLLLVIAFGFGRDFGITAFALFAGVLGMLGLMALGHVKLNFLSFIAVPITIGIGVDYPFNVAARLRGEDPSGRGFGRGLLQTGGAVVLCSTTTVIGYAVLLLSDTGAIRSFGMAAVLGELTCLVAGVVAVPSLLLLAGRFRRHRPVAEQPEDEALTCSSRG